MRGAAGAPGEPWRLSGCGSPREENSWAGAGPLGLGRTFSLLVTQITDLNGEGLDVEQGEEARMRQAV